MRPLTTRDINRATLCRQFLLERSTVPVLDALEHLVGLQAQVPTDPYTALWSRLADFDPLALSALLERRRAAIDHAGARLQALSPLATLARAYAIVRSGAGAVRDATNVEAGDSLDVQLATGSLAARVEEVRP